MLKLGTPLLHTQAQNTLYRIFNFALGSRSALTQHNFFRRSKLKKSVTTYFSPCIDEVNKKNRNKIGAKMKTLEAKPFDQNAENWTRENRLFTSTVARGRRLGAKSNRYAHTQKSSKSLICFRCSSSCFLLENWHSWSRKSFPRQITPRSREKTATTAVFRHRWTGMKSCTVDRGCTPAPKDATKLAVFFHFFSSLSFDISIKNSVQRLSSDLQDLFCVKIRKMAQGSNDLSTLPLSPGLYLTPPPSPSLLSHSLPSVPLSLSLSLSLSSLSLSSSYNLNPFILVFNLHSSSNVFFLSSFSSTSTTLALLTTGVYFSVQWMAGKNLSLLQWGHKFDQNCAFLPLGANLDILFSISNSLSETHVYGGWTMFKICGTASYMSAWIHPIIMHFNGTMYP